MAFNDALQYEVDQVELNNSEHNAHDENVEWVANCATRKVVYMGLCRHSDTDTQCIQDDEPSSSETHSPPIESVLPSLTISRKISIVPTLDEEAVILDQFVLDRRNKLNQLRVQQIIQERVLVEQAMDEKRSKSLQVCTFLTKPFRVFQCWHS
jgi:hypothetical protein